MLRITIIDNSSKISAVFSEKSELFSICYRASQMHEALFNRFMELRTKDTLKSFDSIKQAIEEAGLCKQTQKH